MILDDVIRDSNPEEAVFLKKLPRSALGVRDAREVTCCPKTGPFEV